MTQRTIRWVALPSMVRVARAVVIRHVTCAAVCGGTCISIRMALITARVHVLTGQGEAGIIVIKGRWGPCRFTVTLGTIGRESGLYVVRCCGPVVV